MSQAVRPESSDPRQPSEFLSSNGLSDPVRRSIARNPETSGLIRHQRLRKSMSASAEISRKSRINSGDIGVYWDLYCESSRGDLIDSAPSPDSEARE